MRKSMTMALGAGLLAVVLLHLPGAVLAGAGDRSLQLESTNDAAQIVLVAAPSGQRPSATVARQPTVGKPKISTTPAAYRPSTCYPGTKTAAQWTYLKDLPPPKLCNGKIIEHYGKVCIHCGGFAPTHGQTCVSCKSGYMWNAAKQACCRGSLPLPIPK